MRKILFFLIVFCFLFSSCTNDVGDSNSTLEIEQKPIINDIEEVKEKNNLKYSSEALDLIIREHRQNSDITTEAMIKIIAKEVSEQIKFDMKEIKNSSNNTDRNTQILLELINGFFVISEYGRLATTEDIIAPALPRAIDLVDKRRENSMRFR